MSTLRPSKRPSALTKVDLSKFKQVKSVEKCHPNSNGYTEIVKYYDNGNLKHTKKIIACTKCKMIGDALMSPLVESATKSFLSSPNSRIRTTTL